MDGLQQDIITDIDADQIDPQVYDLYDQYCHSDMDRREFLKRAAALSVVGAVSGLAMAQALLPRYAEAQTVSFTDSRIKAKYVTYDSPGGNSGKMRGYLVHPAGAGPFPAVLIVHENRGLNPHIEDVARRAALDGFIALAPDALYPLGGYPGNDDDGKVMQKKLNRGKISVDMLNGAKWLKSHSLSNGKLAATGFCFGGGVVNYLAVKMGSDLQAGAPY
jgi:carboxymethylenebutenolidase